MRRARAKADAAKWPARGSGATVRYFSTSEVGDASDVDRATVNRWVSWGWLEDSNPRGGGTGSGGRKLTAATVEDFLTRANEPRASADRVRAHLVRCALPPEVRDGDVEKASREYRAATGLDLERAKTHVRAYATYPSERRVFRVVRG